MTEGHTHNGGNTTTTTSGGGAHETVAVHSTSGLRNSLLDPINLPAGFSIMSHRRTASSSTGHSSHSKKSIGQGSVALVGTENEGLSGGTTSATNLTEGTRTGGVAGVGGTQEQHHHHHHLAHASSSASPVTAGGEDSGKGSGSGDSKRVYGFSPDHGTHADDGPEEVNPGFDRDQSSQPLAAAATTVSTSTIPSSSSKSRKSRSSPKQPQSLLTKALLSYLNFFRVVQPLASAGAVGTIAPVLAYFRTQTMFPTIQATLYVFTATLGCCSFFFSIIYVVDVFYRKPLFWPFTNRHFRQTSKARIGGDLVVCMVFCGLWFLAMIGLIIDTIWVDCSKVTGLSTVILENGKSLKAIQTVCHLEKATLGLAVVCWACWFGVLLVLLYGHFWKRRQVIAERLRDRLSRRHAPREGASSAISSDAGQAGSISGRGVGVGGSNAVDTGSLSNEHPSRGAHPSHDYSCQDMEGEVGLTGIICRYDDESTLGGSRRLPPTTTTTHPADAFTAA